MALTRVLKAYCPYCFRTFELREGERMKVTIFDNATCWHRPAEG